MAKNAIGRQSLYRILAGGYTWLAMRLARERSVAVAMELGRLEARPVGIELYRLYGADLEICKSVHVATDADEQPLPPDSRTKCRRLKHNH